MKLTQRQRETAVAKQRALMKKRIKVVEPVVGGILKVR